MYISCSLLVHAATDQSVKPGINKHYEGARYEEWVTIFESPGREIYDRRQDIVNALDLKPGMSVADIGAGTGFFTHMFSRLVGPDGLVYAVDITADFIANIKRTSREQGLANVKAILNNEHEAMLPENSIDLAFLCDTYHHFEYPQHMLSSIYRALKPGSELIVIDYRKIAGRSTPWVMSHVRADKTQVVKEIEAAGFEFQEEKDLLVSNYFLRFTRLHHMVPGGTVDTDR